MGDKLFLWSEKLVLFVQLLKVNSALVPFWVHMTYLIVHKKGCILKEITNQIVRVFIQIIVKNQFNVKFNGYSKIE